MNKLISKLLQKMRGNETLKGQIIRTETISKHALKTMQTISRGQTSSKLYIDTWIRINQINHRGLKCKNVKAAYSTSLHQ